MPIVDDIAAIDANPALTADEKRAQKYAVKTTALIDVILNGKPSPNPIPPLVGRTYTLDGKTITTHAAIARPDNRLVIDATINGARHQFIITNPPVLPRVLTGNEKQDLIQAASEMLASWQV